MSMITVSSRAGVLAALAGLATHVRVAEAQYSVARLIATGERAVGAPAPMTDAAAPLIDQYGQVAAMLNVSGASTRHIVRGLNQMATMLKVGQAAPGREWDVVGEVGALRTVAPDGEIAVSYNVVGYDWAVAVGDPFDWGMGYRVTWVIPGREWEIFLGLPRTYLLAAGRHGAFEHVADFGEGVYTRQATIDGPLRRVKASGDEAGDNIFVESVDALANRADGQVLFAYSLVHDGMRVGRRLGMGSWSVDDQDLVTSNESAPDGGQFDMHAPVRGSFNEAGQTVFVWKTLVANANLDKGVWLYTPGAGLSRVMREGFGVPGHAGLAFGEPHDYAGVTNMMRSPVVGGGGHVVFVSRLRGSSVTASNDTALFVKNPGAPAVMIAREGEESAIDEPAWGDFLDTDVNFWVNGRGDVLFKANRVDNGEVLRHRSADGMYEHNLAQTGRTLPGAGGVPRTVYGIANPDRCSGGEDGRGTVLNESGQVAFSVVFTDGTHAIYRAAVPTPPAECPADFDGDGFVTGLDFDAFVAAFESGEPAADFDADGFITGLDFDAFVAAFEEGC